MGNWINSLSRSSQAKSIAEETSLKREITPNKFFSTFPPNTDSKTLGNQLLQTKAVGGEGIGVLRGYSLKGIPESIKSWSS